MKKKTEFSQIELRYNSEKVDNDRLAINSSIGDSIISGSTEIVLIIKRKCLILYEEPLSYHFGLHLQSYPVE